MNVHKLDLPRMKEGDDPVVFINYLDSALKSSKVPENEWPDLVQTRIMLVVGQNLGDVFGNEYVTLQNIKDAITYVDGKSFAVTAEAIIDTFKDGIKITPRALADKFQGLLRNLLQEAETEAKIIEKLTVACVRSTLNKELKQYRLDGNYYPPEFIIKINEWVDCKAEGKPIYQHEQRERLGMRGARESGFKKKVTCFYCGKVDHVSCECREPSCNTSLDKKNCQLTIWPTSARPDGKMVVCLTYHQNGHKSHSALRRSHESRKFRSQ